MTREDLAAIVRGLAPVLREIVTTAQAEQVATLQTVTARVTALETDRPTLADLPTLRDRVVRLEAGAAALADVAPVLGALRERVAVVEARAPVAGPPGPPGPEGLGCGDLQAEYDGERTVAVKVARGDQVKTLATLALPIDIYRGVYEPGKSYQVGDRVTWEGSEWRCGEASSTKPLEGSKAWKLVVKRGRDGKDARGGA
jgi:hypothetical protein